MGNHGSCGRNLLQLSLERRCPDCGLAGGFLLAYLAVLANTWPCRSHQNLGDWLPHTQTPRGGDMRPQGQLRACLNVWMAIVKNLFLLNKPRAGTLSHLP